MQHIQIICTYLNRNNYIRNIVVGIALVAALIIAYTYEKNKTDIILLLELQNNIQTQPSIHIFPNWQIENANSCGEQEYSIRYSNSYMYRKIFYTFHNDEYKICISYSKNINFSKNSAAIIVILPLLALLLSLLIRIVSINYIQSILWRQLVHVQSLLSANANREDLWRELPLFTTQLSTIQQCHYASREIELDFKTSLKFIYERLKNYKTNFIDNTIILDDFCVTALTIIT